MEANSISEETRVEMMKELMRFLKVAKEEKEDNKKSKSPLTMDNKVAEEEEKARTITHKPSKKVCKELEVKETEMRTALLSSEIWTSALDLLTISVTSMRVPIPTTFILRKEAPPTS